MNSRVFAYFLAVLLVTAVPVFGALTDGLALYYSFDTNMGSTIYDQSGNGHNALVKGAQYTDAGVSGGAYQFNGTNWLEAGDILDLVGTTTQLTACAWVKAKTLTVTTLEPVIISKMQEAAPYSGWFLFQSFYNTGVGVIVATHPERVYGESASIIGDEQWHFVCSTYETCPSLMRCRIYVDGLLKNTDTRTGTYGSTKAATPLTIGTRQPNSIPHWGFNGLIDEVRIYDRVLSDADIAALYELNKPVEPSDALITAIGFSNASDGDQDVTEFMAGETLYITLKDVDMSSAEQSSNPLAFLSQRAGRRMIRENVLFTRQPDGSFTGSCSLSKFQKGRVSITVYVMGTSGELLARAAAITIH